MAPRLGFYPDYPPRVRVEWLIATTRVVLAGGALLATAIRPFTPGDWITTYSLGWYLIYSLVVLALVWTPVRFARGWDVLLHLVDLAAFSAFVFFTEGTASPFYVYFIFLLICSTLRWELRGAVITASAAIVMYAGISLYALVVMGRQEFNTFVIRIVHLIVVAILLGYLGAFHHRFQREIGRLVSWPRKLPHTPRDLVQEIITQSAEILEAPRVLLVWEEPEEGYVNLAFGGQRAMTWEVEPEAAYGSFVNPGLEHRSFQAPDVSDDSGRVIHWSADSFLQRHGRPISTALQSRFDIHAAQSWALEGELIRGRLFVLDKRRMRIDDLVFGEVVARLAVSRLDNLYLLRRLSNSAALEERLRVARDLHDSLLQTIAGTALQLLAARRLLERDPAAARGRLEDVQNQLEHGELEMRSYIRGLRPATSPKEQPPRIGLNHRLDELRQRVERQWEIKTRMRLDVSADDWPDAIADNLYRIVQEGVLNAARHADASVISVDFAMEGDKVKVRIADDGRGFPFQGSYDLRALNELNQGPLTLKERVADLGGDLTLNTTDTGTELLIVVPLVQVVG
jgi:signal transduction histidine kinase